MHLCKDMLSISLLTLKYSDSFIFSTLCPGESNSSRVRALGYNSFVTIRYLTLIPLIVRAVSLLLMKRTEGGRVEGGVGTEGVGRDWEERM